MTTQGNIRHSRGLRLNELSQTAEQLLARGVVDAALFCRDCARIFCIELRAIVAPAGTAYRDLAAAAACACTACGSKDLVMLPPGLDEHLDKGSGRPQG
ncbi:MAG: hypothetical protein KGM42_13020 [Hyphomicrobiales bacterium]|nr:hypothetical protein [Hyphomicrobiales bacterium]